MRLQFILQGQDNERHPFYVRSNWVPPVQPSVALETFLEEVKVDLAEIQLSKPKHNLPYNERMAIRELKRNSRSEINIKKADKGTTTVVMNKQHKIREGQEQLDNRTHYLLLDIPMAESTQERVQRVIDTLYREKHIDDMTKKWLSQTPNPPRVPIFYTLTNIHKPTPVGRPIISGCDGPTERISSFVDYFFQPIAKAQKSYLKDTTDLDFINFIERTKIPKNTTLVFMDVTSLYTNIPQEEGITTVCKAYEAFYNRNIPIPTNPLKEMLQLILGENSFSFNARNYLQTHGTAMGTKMAVVFADIFMSEVETEIKFRAEISEKEINFLDTAIFKGERFHNDHILDVRAQYKSTETFQYTYFTSCHAPCIGKGFIKGEGLRLLRTNSSEHTFMDNIANFKLRLFERGNPVNLVNTPLQKYNSRRESPPSRIKTKGERTYCLSSRNTIQ